VLVKVISSTWKMYLRIRKSDRNWQQKVDNSKLLTSISNNRWDSCYRTTN